jgi:FkbM family methyltransferase
MNLGMLQERVIDLLRPLNFRGKRRLVTALAPSNGERTISLFGQKMRLDISEHIQRNIYLGVFERMETGLVSAWLKPGMVFVDVGANVGYYSLLAASLVGAQGRVVAVEPSPYAYQRLKQTITSGNLPNIAAVQLALGSANTTLDLPMPSETGWIHSPSFFSDDVAKVNVKVRKLDDCMDEWGISVVDLIKIDVEGFELEVLRGAESSLRSGRIRAILCEFNDVWLQRAGSSPAELLQMILDAGFQDTSGLTGFEAGCVQNRFLVCSRIPPPSP